MLQTFLAAAGLAFGLLAPMRLQAQQYDSRDVAMLPAFCKYAQGFRAKVPGGNDPAKIEGWYSAMGPTFHHMHHYCYGLIDTNRAIFFSRNRQERTHLLSASIRQFDYVIQRAPPDFVLLPEILTKKGENLIRLGQGPHGILELQRAIEIKPDYWPPYAALSDHFEGTQDLAKAREWLEKGLAAAPDTKALQRRLAKLGGGKSERSALPPKTKPQPPAEGAVSAPTPQTASPEPPAER